MRISDLPLATNYAKLSPQQSYQQKSSQHTNDQTRPVSEEMVSKSKLTRSLAPSDNDYTKEDAVLSQWNRAGSFNLYDVLNGTGTIRLQKPNPSAEELAEFEKSLQENGMEENIDLDLSNFAFGLRGIGFGTHDPLYQLSAEDFSRKTDYLASRYAAMQAKIQNSLPESEQSTRTEKLNALYQGALEEMATAYADIVGGFLGANGVSGERNKIYQSFIDGVNGKSAAYQEYLSENPDFMGLKGTKDEWLLQDDAYVAASLRAKGSQAIAAANQKDRYSLNDMDVLGRYVSELSSWEKTANAVNVMSEERIGLDFAMLSMKTDALRKAGGVSVALESTLQNMLDGFMNGFLDRMDQQLTSLRNKGAARKDGTGYAALDRQAVWNVYHKTMAHYNASGNAVTALMEGARQGASQAMGKSGNGIYRYANSSQFWTNFFEKEETGASRPYTSDETFYQQYVAGWKSFESSLRQDSKGVQLNMKLKSASSYQSFLAASYINVKA